MTMRYVRYAIIALLLGVSIFLLILNGRLRSENKACLLSLEQVKGNLASAQKKNEELVSQQHLLIQERQKLNIQIKTLNEHLTKAQEQLANAHAKFKFQRKCIKDLEREKLEMIERMLALKIEKETLEQKLGISSAPRLGQQPRSKRIHVPDEDLIGNRGFIMKDGKAVYFTGSHVEVVPLEHKD